MTRERERERERERTFLLISRGHNIFGFVSAASRQRAKQQEIANLHVDQYRRVLPSIPSAFSYASTVQDYRANYRGTRRECFGWVMSFYFGTKISFASASDRPSTRVWSFGRTSFRFNYRSFAFYQVRWILIALICVRSHTLFSFFFFTTAFTIANILSYLCVLLCHRLLNFLGKFYFFPVEQYFIN